MVAREDETGKLASWALAMRSEDTVRIHALAKPAPLIRTHRTRSNKAQKSRLAARRAMARSSQRML